jgi:hypothetical protein
VPNVTVHYGSFLTNEASLPLVNFRPGEPRFARVLTAVVVAVEPPECRWQAESGPCTRVRRPAGGGSTSVQTAVRTEEKGSDVNLATLLLCDAYENDCDAAIVVTNDSDLVMPIRIVRDRLKKDVVLLCPASQPSAELRTVATYVKSIRKGVLRASQLPPTLSDAHGTITRPPTW